MAELVEQLEQQEQETLSTEDGDHDVFAHYVEKEEVADAVIYGWPVVALCGKIWIPYRDPSKYPICPTCQKILQDMMSAFEDTSS